MMERIIFIVPSAALVLILWGFYFFSRKKAWIFSVTMFIVFSAILIYGSEGTPTDIFLLAVFLINLVGAFSVLLFFFKKMEGRVREVMGKLQEIEALHKQREELRSHLKAKIEILSKEIHRSLSLYGAIRGLGVALTWDEMVPHIDFAIHQCLGVADYQLYLTEDSGEVAANSSAEGKNSFKKALARGARLLEPATELQASLPRLVEKQNETYLSLPISQNSKVIGFLWARIPRIQIPVKKEEILTQAQELAEELGMGLQKALLFGSIEKHSRTDGLTGVFRRHVFNERLNEEFRRAGHFRTVFSLLIADLDHFKQINDTYGHQAGDEVLRRVGEILKESVYETDFVARYGGEEFVILFPQAEPEGVKRKAELLRARVAGEDFVFGWNKIRISVSIGIAHFPQDGTDPSTLLNTADQLLYAAKRLGRNRVVTSTDLNS